MSKRKHYEDFWDEFEAECASVGLVSKLPNCMKSILNAVGYNHSWAFKDVDHAKISELESFVERRHRNVADKFDEYKEVKPFEFLPGHRTLILGIQSQLLSMENSKKPKTAKPKPKPKIISNENDLKQILIQQISSFSASNSLKMDWSNAVQQFKIQTDHDVTSAECSLMCPRCNAVRIIRYEKSWKISNMCKHIRSHIEKNESDQNPSNRGKDKKISQRGKNLTGVATNTRSIVEFNPDGTVVNDIEEYIEEYDGLDDGVIVCNDEIHHENQSDVEC